MADEDKGDAKKGNLLGQIITSVAIAILVGGTSPWWFNAFFGKSAPNASPQQAALNQQVAVKPQSTSVNNQDAPLVASRDFVLGRWRVEQSFGSASGANVVDYFSNGRFEKTEMDVVGNQGQRITQSGTWEFEKLSDQAFRLT